MSWVIYVQPEDISGAGDPFTSYLVYLVCSEHAYMYVHTQFHKDSYFILLSHSAQTPFPQDTQPSSRKSPSLKPTTRLCCSPIQPSTWAAGFRRHLSNESLTEMLKFVFPIGYSALPLSITRVQYMPPFSIPVPRQHQSLHVPVDPVLCHSDTANFPFHCNRTNPMMTKAQEILSLWISPFSVQCGIITLPQMESHSNHTKPYAVFLIPVYTSLYALVSPHMGMGRAVLRASLHVLHVLDHWCLAHAHMQYGMMVGFPIEFCKTK